MLYVFYGLGILVIPFLSVFALLWGLGSIINHRKKTEVDDEET